MSMSCGGGLTQASAGTICPSAAGLACDPVLLLPLLRPVVLGELLTARHRLEPAMGNATSPIHQPDALSLSSGVQSCLRPTAPHTTPAPDGGLCRTNFSADLTQQLDVPLQFVDFLREPEVDANTGEITNEHPSYYESVQGGLPDIKCASCSGFRVLLHQLCLACGYWLITRGLDSPCTC